MNNQFKNIFVSLEVAKLAREKGFNEPCAGFYPYWIGDDSEIFPNSTRDGGFDLTRNSQTDDIQAPTHYQLIQWLRINHKLDVWFGYPETWIIYQEDFKELGRDQDINQALIKALNLIK